MEEKNQEERTSLYVALDQEFEYKDNYAIDEAQAHRDFVQIGKICLFYLILQLLFGLLGGFLIGNFYFTDMNSYNNASMIISFVSTILAGLIVIRSAKKKLRINSESLYVKNPLSLTALLRYTFIAIGIAVCGSFIMTLLNAMVIGFGFQFSTPDLTVKNDLVYDIVFIASALIAAPMIEELIFRGIFTQALLRYDVRFAVIGSALLFSMMHLNLVQGVPTFLLGLILGYVFVKTKSVKACIFIHFMNNLLSVGANYAQLANEQWLSIFGLGVLLLILYGIVGVVKYHRQFFANLPTNTKEHHLVRSFFNSWSIVIFIIICMFVTFSVYLLIL